MVKPFLKWAGGKSKILNEIIHLLPENFESKQITYVEPFVGGGGIFFGLTQHFNNFERIILNDINADLINTYKVIKQDVKELIEILSKFQCEYYNSTHKDVYYYEKRAIFNLRKKNNIEQAAIFIFLNRTCFNGLFRVNKKNEFNVPIGKYKKPEICNEANLLKVSKHLENVELYSGDYEDILSKVNNEKCFFYLDPPYKPVSKTAYFNSYSHIAFNDDEQRRLKIFCDKLNSLKNLWVLSNSDMSDHEKFNSFFDDLYSDYKIDYIEAKRHINSKAENRGDLKELIIINNLEENFTL